MKYIAVLAVLILNIAPVLHGQALLIPKVEELVGGEVTLDAFYAPFDPILGGSIVTTWTGDIGTTSGGFPPDNFCDVSVEAINAETVNREMLTQRREASL